MEGGWIKLHRKLRDSEMYKRMNHVQRDILINILMAVNYKEKEWSYKGVKYIAKPGQLVTSLDSICKMCAKGTTKQNVRTALANMESTQFLTKQSTHTGMLITIVNWAEYQGGGEQANTVINIETNLNLTPTKEVKKYKKKDSVQVSEKKRGKDKFQTKLETNLLAEWINSGRDPDDTRGLNAWIKRGGIIHELYRCDGDSSRKSTDWVSADR